MRKNHIFITGILCLVMLLMCTSCSAILAPKVLNVTANYECGNGYLVGGSALCDVVLTINDKFDWHEVTLTINDNYIYSLKIPVIKSDTTYTANLANFTLSDGTRFDIILTKPMNFEVTSGEGTYYGVWN